MEASKYILTIVLMLEARGARKWAETRWLQGLDWDVYMYCTTLHLNLLLSGSSADDFARGVTMVCLWLASALPMTPLSTTTTMEKLKPEFWNSYLSWGAFVQVVIAGKSLF